MSELRDAISKVVHDRWWSPDMDADEAAALANAVLAMPELQAIRKALHEVAGQRGYYDLAESLADLDLPPSVVAWVLDGET